MLTRAHVIQEADYSSPLRHEFDESRYRWALLLSFSAAFAAIGPFIAAGTYGPWLRHAVYGLVVSLAAVVGTGLIVAAATGQIPLRSDTQPTWALRLARVYGLPLALLLGPYLGFALGRFWAASARQST